MTFARVVDGSITESRTLPNAARRLDNRAWVLGFPAASVELHEACGWFPVIDAVRPPDDDVTTHDRSIELVAGVPSVVWTPRPWTVTELAARTATANGDTIRTQAAAALDTNRTFLAIVTPTNAQTLAEVKALARQNNGLIRLILNQLDGTT